MLISVSKFIKPREGGGGGDSKFAENIPISVRQVLVKREQRQNWVQRKRANFSILNFLINLTRR